MFFMMDLVGECECLLKTANKSWPRCNMLVWAVPDQGFHCGHHFNSRAITDFGGRVVVNRCPLP